jgi:hypothetical protein
LLNILDINIIVLSLHYNLKIKKMKNVIYFLTIIMSVFATSCTKPQESLKIGDIYKGGYVFQIKTADTPGLICSTVILSEKSDWDNAVQLCNAYSINGITGWRLPTYYELKLIYQDLTKEVDFNFHQFWSSTPAGNLVDSYGVYPDPDGILNNPWYKTNLYCVLAVKNF